ncbi:unnamed protein product, partial [Arabidopsis halleri]
SRSGAYSFQRRTDTLNALIESSSGQAQQRDLSLLYSGLL